MAEFAEHEEHGASGAQETAVPSDHMERIRAGGAQGLGHGRRRGRLIGDEFEATGRVLTLAPARRPAAEHAVAVP